MRKKFKDLYVNTMPVQNTHMEDPPHSKFCLLTNKLQLLSKMAQFPHFTALDIMQTQ
jgi:hypothetical protein